MVAASSICQALAREAYPSEGLDEDHVVLLTSMVISEKNRELAPGEVSQRPVGRGEGRCLNSAV
jgi:hypothetical protein